MFCKRENERARKTGPFAVVGSVFGTACVDILISKYSAKILGRNSHKAKEISGV